MRFKPRFWGGWLALLLSLSPAGAQTQTAPDAPVPAPVESDLLLGEDLAADPALQAASAGGGFLDFLWMVLVLALVVAMVYGFVWLLRRLSTQGQTPSENFRILGTLALPGKSAIHLVEVYGEILVLGSGEGPVTLLKELSDSEVRDAVRLAASRRPAAPRNFKDLLNVWFPKPLGSGVSAPENPSAGDSDPSFLKKQRERLKNLQ